MVTRAALDTAARPVPPPTRPAWAKFDHRPAIDGLRAIAALLVVLFHAGLPGLGNGFVGVDVFFVLSGFLITSLLAREVLADHRVQLVRFYARRARRLFPAALLVLVVTAVLYQQFATPLAVFDNRWGFAAAALYASNWLFMAQSQDYFAEAASPSPVLHYWSLSVEEQFYLVWPLLLIGLMALPLVRRRLAPVLVGLLAGGALLGSAWLSSEHLTSAYFATFARAYQLLLGAALGLTMLWLARSGRRAPRPLPALAPWLLSLGVIAVVVVATTLGPANPWWTGVLGCLATVAVLAGVELGAGGPVARMLRNPVARWLGVWSYAIYLWHWPVIVIGDQAGRLPEQWWARVPIVTGLTVLLAALTWLLVERPAALLRLRTLRQQRRIVLLGLTGTVTTAVTCTALLWPSAQTQLLVDQAARDTSSDAAGVTVAGGSSPTRTVLMVGDSHALFLRPGLEQYAERKGFRVVTVTQSACPWADFDVLQIGTDVRYGCDRELRQPALAAVREYRPDLTILVSRSITVRDARAADGTEHPAGTEAWVDEVRGGMTRFLDRIEPYTGQVVIVEPMPETAASMIECLSTPTPSSECAQAQTDSLQIEIVEQLEREIAAASTGVASVSLDSLICPDRWCPASVDGIPTHRDTHHLTDAYATKLVPQVDDLLRERGKELALAPAERSDR